MRAQPPGTDSDYNQIIVQALEQYKRGDLNDSEYRRVLSEVSHKLSISSVSGQKILSHSYCFLIKVDCVCDCVDCYSQKIKINLVITFAFY